MKSAEGKSPRLGLLVLSLAVIVVAFGSWRWFGRSGPPGLDTSRYPGSLLSSTEADLAFWVAQPLQFSRVFEELGESNQGLRGMGLRGVNSMVVLYGDELGSVVLDLSPLSALWIRVLGGADQLARELGTLLDAELEPRWRGRALSLVSAAEPATCSDCVVEVTSSADAVFALSIGKDAGWAPQNFRGTMALAEPDSGGWKLRAVGANEVPMTAKSREVRTRLDELNAAVLARQSESVDGDRQEFYWFASPEEAKPGVLVVPSLAVVCIHEASLPPSAPLCSWAERLSEWARRGGLSVRKSSAEAANRRVVALDRRSLRGAVAAEWDAAQDQSLLAFRHQLLAEELDKLVIGSAGFPLLVAQERELAGLGSRLLKAAPRYDLSYLELDSGELQGALVLGAGEQ